MERELERREPQPPQSWGDLIGPVVRAAELDESLRLTSGLLVLKTREGTEVCPAFQFDKDEAGNTRVNPYIGLAWQLLTALQIDQLEESTWTNAGSLAQARPNYSGRSWAEVLKDEAITDRDKLPIYAEIVGDAVYASGWSGTPLIDPRRLLPR